VARLDLVAQVRQCFAKEESERTKKLTQAKSNIMDIQEEIDYSRMLIAEAKKRNPQMGSFIELTSKPLSGNITVKLTNGTALIRTLILREFRRSGKKTPPSFIEEVALSFESNEKKTN
jgi:hypothetical protein